jgi:undecaprenyl-diphosphatase
LDKACSAGIDVGFVTLGYARVAILGVVQGLSELLPISSTAHMRVVPALMGWRDPGSAFSAAMQLAALAAVVSYFWADIRRLAVNATAAARERRFGDHDLRFVVGVVVGTVPLVIAGILLSSALNACDSAFRTLPVIGIACIIMGLLLILSELVATHRRTLGQSTLLDAVIIGLAQVGALIPGVSRSGSTLTAALLLGFKRTEAARFSFLLGLPAIFLAGVRELWLLRHAELGAQGWGILATGIFVASLSAFAAVWLLMRILERFETWPFAVYRIVLGAVLLLMSVA